MAVLRAGLRGVVLAVSGHHVLARRRAGVGPALRSRPRPRRAGRPGGRACSTSSAIDRAVLCGVSFGGLVALRFAATRPARTAGLVLVSTPGPGFHLKRRHEIYARLPWLFGPVFLAEMPSRVGREIAAAIPDRAARRRFRWRQMRTFLKAPLSLSRMAARARLIGGHGERRAPPRGRGGPHADARAQRRIAPGLRRADGGHLRVRDAHRGRTCGVPRTLRASGLHHEARGIRRGRGGLRPRIRIERTSDEATPRTIARSRA